MIYNYFAIYKCGLCGKEFRIADKPFEANEEDLPNIMGKIIRNQQFLGSQFYNSPIILPHKCGDGNGGMAQLIGFKTK